MTFTLALLILAIPLLLCGLADAVDGRKPRKDKP
jgi:hypothetical protein